MKIYPKWKVKIHEGKVVFEQREQFDSHLIPYEGKIMSLVLKPYTKRRSRQEEKYYHAVVVRMIADEMGETDDNTHNLLRGLFLEREKSAVLENGEVIRYTRILSTTELNDKQYREYWKQCVDWAAQPTKDTGLAQDSGIKLYIPLPNETDYDDY